MKSYKLPMKVSEIQVSYRPKKAHKPQLLSSDDTFEVLTHCYDWDTIGYTEKFICLYLNRANRVLGYKVISQGGVSGTLVDVKVILGVALKCGASSVICSHNHPSNNLNPSQADINLTSKIKRACEIMDLVLLDHIIVNSEGEHYSMADNGEV